MSKIWNKTTFYEKLHVDGQEVISHQVVDGLGSRSMDEHASLYSDCQIIYILNEGQSHFVPVQHKLSVRNKPTEKQAHLSSSEGVQSQDIKVDGLALYSVTSVAMSPQQVSHLQTQPHQLEQGTGRIKSASEAKTH